MVDVDTTPLVSICCLSYNHAPFLKECLDGFMMQKTDFEYEVLIHDDCSTDGSDQIIKEYASKYPSRIFPLFEDENQYSKGMESVIDIAFNYNRARGKYIAYCEGDDYWTDPQKLQKQVDFMESHPDYSVCFHRCSHLNSENGKFSRDKCGRYLKKDQVGVDITMEMFFGPWVTQPLTMVFRRSMFTPEWQKQYRYYRDMHEIYHLLTVGKGYLFAFNGGVYRYHQGGIHSMISKDDYCVKSLPIDREFYEINPSEYSKCVYLETLSESIRSNARMGRYNMALKYLQEYLKVSKNLRTTTKLLLYIRKHKNAGK